MILFLEIFKYFIYVKKKNFIIINKKKFIKVERNKVK